MGIPVYGIFEGGGAKGLAHIAGVAAAERNNLEFIGVAGASAGALIAALIAVGYTAQSLFDPHNPHANLLTRHNISPLGLLDEKAWKRFKKAQSQVSGGWWSRLTGLSWLRVAREIFGTRGYFDTELIREKLNYFLRVKLQEHHANAGRVVNLPERIRFRDIAPEEVEECCSLRIIVTDVTNQRPVVFGPSPDHADVEVAEVVAASISIPFFFKPARIRSYSKAPNALYADGALVSNLPIWVFAEEKLNYERTQSPKCRVPILAFSLVASQRNDGQASGQISDGFGPYLAAIGRSAIFGGQTVVNVFVSDLVPLPIPVDLETTEFEFTLERALKAYYDAYAVVGGSLGREIRVKPAQIKEVLTGFRSDVLKGVSHAAPAPLINHLRVCLMEPFGTTSFRIVHSLNMEGDADDRLVFSNLVQGAPSAFFNKCPAYIDFASTLAQGTNANMTKYEFALLRKQLKSAICFPVFDQPQAWAEPVPAQRPQPLGVVAIDSDDSLNHIFVDAGILQSLAVMSLRFRDAFKP